MEQAVAITLRDLRGELEAALRVASVNAVVEISDHLHRNPAAIFEGPAGALVAVAFLKRDLQDRLVCAAMIFVEIGFLVHAEVLHVFVADAVFRQALTKIPRNEAEDFFFHVHCEAFSERNVDPRPNKKIDQAARFRNEFALDHLFRRNAKRFPEHWQHARVAADCRGREFFADLLRDPVFELWMPFKKTNELVIYRCHSSIDLEGERVPVFDPALEPCTRQCSGAQIGKKRRWLHFSMISIENYFPNRLGLLLCFLRGQFAMFGHGLNPFG